MPRALSSEAVCYHLAGSTVMSKNLLLCALGIVLGVQFLEGNFLQPIIQSRTVDLHPAVTGAFTRGGVLWWSTGDQDSLVWHTLDLRTI